MAGDAYVDFAPYYDVVYEPMVDYDGDVRWLLEVFRSRATRPVRRVLDLGCGTGSHAARLVEAGLDVVGVDLSEGLVRLARAKAPRATFHVGDMSDGLPEGPFDAVVSMFGAFNYVVDDARAERVVAMAAERVPAGGLLAFEFWNPIGVRPQKNWDCNARGDLEVVRLFESAYDMREGVVALTMDVLVLEGGRVKESFREDHRLRARTPAEVRRLVERHGFELVAFTGGARDGKTLAEPSHDEFRIMAIARRR